jgi:L-rhamnose mutarotase
MSEEKSRDCKTQRACLVLRIKKNLLKEYEAEHKKIWPEMLDLLRKSGIHNYSIFVRDDGLMVNYFETEDLEGSFKIAQSSPIYDRWQEAMAHYFEAESGDLSGSNSGGILRQIFYLK